MDTDSGSAGPRDGDGVADDLERRIDELLTLDEDSLGSFGVIDWIVLVVGSVVLPVIAFVLAA